MEINDDEILDLPQREHKRKCDFFRWRIGSTIIVSIGLVFKLMHWPLSNLIVLLGVLSWIIWSVVDILTTKNPKLWQISYFLGRTFLGASIVLLFTTKLPWMKYSLAAASVCFLVGFVTAPRDSFGRP